MSAQLNDFIDTKHLEVDGECRKVRSWIFANEEHCVPGECQPNLLLIFEDGTREYAQDLSEVQNC